MWIVKWILGALLIILILGFAFQNQHQMVQVHVWRWVSPEVPLYLIVYIRFSFGMVTWLLVSVFKIMQLKVECRLLRNQNDQLKGELNSLRNLSVEEAVEPETTETSSE
jgi:uncharacterized integral membrane protein